MPASSIRRHAGTILVVVACAGAPAAPARAAAAPLPAGCDAVTTGNAAVTRESAPIVFPPVQIALRTPVEPTVLPSGGRNVLVYEVHLHNFMAAPATIQGLDVLDADHPGRAPLAGFRDAALRARLRGATLGEGTGDPRRLAAGQGVVAYLCLAFDAAVPVPARLRHRVLLDGSSADGPAIGTRTTPLRVLGRPLVGAGWTPANTPSLESHHRMGLWVVDGAARISRRYAIDWKKYDVAGQAYAGDPRDVHAYYAYGENVLAVADGRVVAARDGMPDNVPKTAAGFAPAVPVTLDTVGGNQVVIDLGNGQYAAYYHLQPGSVRVRAGDSVKRGQWLARIGNSGDARWPHLHFQVTDGPDAMASEGLPYLFEHYRIRTGAAGWEDRRDDYPLGDAIVDFGPDACADCTP